MRTLLLTARCCARTPVRVFLKIGTHAQQSFWACREPRVGELLRIRTEKYAKEARALVDKTKDMDGYTLFYAERM